MADDDQSIPSYPDRTILSDSRAPSSVIASIDLRSDVPSVTGACGAASRDALDVWANTAQWSSVAAGGAWGAAIRGSSVRRFVREYFEAHRQLPLGAHDIAVYHGRKRIGSLDVVFPYGLEVSERVLAGEVVARPTFRETPVDVSIPVRKPGDLFYPIEQAILCDWFDIPRPSELVDVVIEEDHYEEIQPLDFIALVSPEGSSPLEDEAPLSNAVARIALEAIQVRLPQWFYCYSNHVAIGRDLYVRKPLEVLLKPLFLFEINWGISAPGIDWPEAYHLIYLPGFDRYVVTASQSSPDCYGFCDVTIGDFAADKPPVPTASAIVRRWWQDAVERGQPYRWHFVQREGAVSEEQVFELAADFPWELPEAL